MSLKTTTPTTSASKTSDRKTPTPKALPTFKQICRQYPELARLAEWAELITDEPERPSFCANSSWYDRLAGRPSLRDRVVAIANRAVRRYGSHRVYDTCYDGVYSLLPDCRGACGCFDRGAL